MVPDLDPESLSIFRCTILHFVTLFDTFLGLFDHSCSRVAACVYTVCHYISL